MSRAAVDPARPFDLDTYGSLVNRAFFPLWEATIKRRPTLDYLELLHRTQRASVDELRSIQLARLRTLLEHAYTDVPYYRERFRSAGVEPADVRTLDDIVKLPILGKAEAQRTVSERTSTTVPIAWSTTTSGTLGVALAFGFDYDTEFWRQAAKIRAYGWGGYRVGARTLYYVGVNHGLVPPRGQQLKTKIERSLKREHYLSCMVRDESRLRRAVDAISRRRVQFMITYPDAAADLARYVIEKRARSWQTIPIMCHGEKISAIDRRVLVEAFGAAIFETYACRETYMIGSECEVHDGLHLTMENVLVEVLVTEGGRPRSAQPGEVGEVVITDLHNRANPFIRYAIGDLAHGIEHEPCACGRTLPRLGAIEGRVVEILRGPSGERISSLLFEQVINLTMGAVIRKYQIIQRRDRSITVKIVPAAGFTASATDALVRELRSMVKGISIATEIVPEIPAGPSGKMRVVIVEA